MYQGYSDIYQGYADIYQGYADIYQGYADIYQGYSDIYQSYADIYQNSCYIQDSARRSFWRKSVFLIQSNAWNRSNNRDCSWSAHIFRIAITVIIVSGYSLNRGWLKLSIYWYLLGIEVYKGSISVSSIDLNYLCSSLYSTNIEQTELVS